MTARVKLPPLFTIGYEQAKPAAVLHEITSHKIKLLVDVRAVAASRRPGFSKRQLSAALDEAGVGYLHLQKLGTPAEGRLAARAGDYDALWRIYDRHLKTAPAQEQMAELIALVKSGKRIGLLCFCRDARHCHRSRITAQIRSRAKTPIEDLVPPLF